MIVKDYDLTGSTKSKGNSTGDPKNITEISERGLVKMYKFEHLK